jgi:hypothetical protein
VAMYRWRETGFIYMRNMENSGAHVMKSRNRIRLHTLDVGGELRKVNFFFLKNYVQCSCLLLRAFNIYVSTIVVLLRRLNFQRYNSQLLSS